MSVYVRSTSIKWRLIARQGESGEGREALGADLKFFLRNLKSRGPSLVQAKGFRATIITIHFVNKALHQTKKKEEEEDKTGDIGGSRFDS